MDGAAELTLQIASFLQTEPEAPRSPARWAFVPGPGQGRYTFAEAAVCLAAIDKPVVIGVLNQPGYLALWRAVGLEAAELRTVEQTLANQLAFLSAKLAHFGAGEEDLVEFEGWGAKVQLPASELRRWLGEYAVTWMWTVGAPTDDTHGARLLVKQSDRRWSRGHMSHSPDPPNKALQQTASAMEAASPLWL
ncbi:MAG: hypothetical protein Q8K82_08475 [Gemmatimonadaceae bacterium]|nr:hypothetical protein [Gemmatimonadaceae bacterium]